MTESLADLADDFFVVVDDLKVFFDEKNTFKTAVDESSGIVRFRSLF